MPQDEQINPYQDPVLLDWFSNMWLIIGATLSVCILSILFINDLFSFIGDSLERARIRKSLSEEKKS